MSEELTNNQSTTVSLAREIYSFYRRLQFKAKKGVAPRAIKDWSKIEAKKEWPYILRFASMVERMNGQIQWKIYVKALLEHTKYDYVLPQLFVSPKGISIYKNYIQQLNDESDPKTLKKGIARSIKFIQKYCLQNSIISFDDYFYKNANVYPVILLHYNSGAITKAFFKLIPNVEKRIHSFPPDIVQDIFTQEDLVQMSCDRICICQKDESINNFCLNFNYLMDSYLNPEDK